MSFILDALKKSESERHRHSGPVLMDVRIAPPRRRLPTWAWVIAGVLLVNLLLLVWLLWLAPNHAPAAAPAIAVAPPVTAPAAVAPAAAPQAAAPQTSTTPGAAPVVPVPVPAPVAPAPTSVAPAGTGLASADAQPIDTTNLPRVQDLIAAGVALPELHLSLHVYDPAPASRYVLLNGARLHEGEITPDGLKLLQITPAGAVLEWRGRRMFLGTGG